MSTGPGTRRWRVPRDDVVAQLMEFMPPLLGREADHRWAVHEPERMYGLERGMVMSISRWNENGTQVLADDQPGSTAEVPVERNNQPR